MKIIDDYLTKSDWKIKENANVGYSMQAMDLYISGETIKKHWLEMYGKEIADAYNDGYLHLHDLSQLSSYCTGLDFEILLNGGYGGLRGYTNCDPPKHLGSALGQLCNFFFGISQEVAGAVAISNFDTLLAPFIREDKLSFEAVKQELQSFIYNMNMSTRIGGQMVFSNLTLDLVPPEHLKNKKVFLAGEKKNYTYGDLQPEIDMLIDALSEVMLEGDADGRVFAFPIITLNLTKDFNWGNHDKLWEVEGKYGTFYFTNFIGSDLNPEDSRSLCCRLSLSVEELRKRNGGLFGIVPLTGSLGVVTLSLPMIAKTGWGDLDYYLGLAKSSLEMKRRLVEKLCEDGLYPFLKQHFQKVKDLTGHYFGNHFSTIGIIGMHEACQVLLGKGIETDEGKKLAEDTMDFILAKTKLFQQETGNLYNLEATPAEGASHSLPLKNLKIFSDIPHEGKEEPYFTNSTMLPVNYSGDLWEVINHQESLQTKYSGGTVLHFFLGEKITGEQARLIVKKIAEKTRLPYYTLTPTFSLCATHGYIAGEVYNCPECNEPTEVYSRIVGYYRPTFRWNNGKQQEFKDRKVFSPQ